MKMNDKFPCLLVTGCVNNNEKFYERLVKPALDDGIVLDGDVNLDLVTEDIQNRTEKIRLSNSTSFEEHNKKGSERIPLTYVLVRYYPKKGVTGERFEIKMTHILKLCRSTGVRIILMTRVGLSEKLDKNFRLKYIQMRDENYKIDLKRI